MDARTEYYNRSIEELIKAHKDEINKQIDKVERLENAVKKLDKKWNARIEVECSKYGPSACVILKPNEKVWKEIEQLINERRNNGPHLYFNSGDDWRKYLTEKKELAPLQLSTNWSSYNGYSYNRYSKEVVIPMYECGVIK